MKTIVFYFSGTGNSLLAARELARQLDDAAVFPVAELLRQGAGGEAFGALTDAQAVGFVFPVYFESLPPIVKKAVEETQFDSEKYFFAAATNGGQAGNTLYELDRALRARGARLDYGRNVSMPDNSILLRTDEREAAGRLLQLKETMGGIAAEVRGGTEEGAIKPSLLHSASGLVNRLAVKYVFGAEKRRADASRCSRCGLCVRICPTGNISMDESGVLFGHDCQWCFACLNWCPNKAVVFGRIDPMKRRQYRCPGVSASDLMRRPGL